MVRHLALSVILLLCISQSQAQIFINRNFEANPLREEMQAERRLLGNTFFGAEMGYGFFSAEREQTWNIKLNGFLEFYRWGNHSSIGLNLAHELHANPYNEIHFNPRGAIWNESLLYYRKLPQGFLQLGANHRCRHNIDNADPPRSDIPRAGYELQSRVLVLTSLFAGYISEPIEFAPNWQADYFARADAYLYREDARLPRHFQEGNWENIWGSAFGGFSIINRLSETSEIYTRNHVNYVAFSEHPDQINYRVELGLSLVGEQAKVSLFVAHERFFDDTSRPYPLPSSVLFVGIRGLGLDFF